MCCSPATQSFRPVRFPFRRTFAGTSASRSPHMLRARRKPADGLVLRLESGADPGTGRRPHVGAASALILSAVVASTGCDRGRSTASFVDGTAVTVSDSAGVEIVENHEPEHPPGAFWTLGEEPEFVLGGGGSEIGANVWEVRDVARLADGRIAILSQGNHQVFLYEPSGRLSRVIGGRGRGPGEFVRPERMQHLPPDTLAVSDYFMGPVTYFDTAGTVLRTRPIDLARTLDLLPVRSAEHPRTPLPNGSFVVAVWRYDPHFERPGEGETYRYPPVEFVRIDSLYRARSLGVWDGLEWWSVPERVREKSAIASPETQTFHLLDSHIAVGGDPPSIYITNGDRNEIHQFSGDGSLIRIIRRTTPAVPVTARADRAWRRRMISLAMSLGQDYLRPFVESMPQRDSWPVVATLVVDARGHLWAREWSDSESGTPDRWSVFGPQGRWLGVLVGRPDPFLCRWPSLPCWIGDDLFLLVRHGEDGAERVEGYAIRKEHGS